MRALALEHLTPDPVTVYGEILEERGVAVDRVRLHLGEPLPDWRGYDFLVAMGGPMSVYEEDEHPWLADEKRAIGEAVRAGVPFLGICFGAQLLASALGARVYRGPDPELDFRPVFLTEEARRDPVFRGFPRGIEVFEWHQDTFDLPEGAVRLARSPGYENQALRWGRTAYAIQAHLEPSLDEVREWFAVMPSVVGAIEVRYGKGAFEVFLDEYALAVPFLQETARQLCRRWLENALALGAAATSRPREAEKRGVRRRDSEPALIDALLDGARKGRGGALVFRGKSGSGKTTLLEQAVTRAEGMHVLRATGVDCGFELPFGGLRELCGPALGEVCSPAATVGDRFAVYTAVLGALREAAAEAPLLLVVDDAHHLDEPSADALAFVTRRVTADPIAVLVATEADAPGAVELRRSGEVPPGETALEHLEGLPVTTRRALLVAALDDAADAETLEQACALLGIDPSALEAAAAAGIVAATGGQIRLHPHTRAAVRYGALRAERRAVHAALAAALPDGEDDRRAWHRALAAAGPTEDVAAPLAELAWRARSQAAYGTAARAYEQAARLTPDADQRARRLLAAADAAQLAGHVSTALDHLETALRDATEAPLRAEIEHLLGRVAARSGSAERALETLLSGAGSREAADPRRAALMLADAVIPCLRSGRPAEACAIGERAVSLASGAGGEVELAALLMHGTALLLAGEAARGAGAVAQAAALADAAAPDRRLRAYLGAGLRLAGDLAGARTVLEALGGEARAEGALGVLPYALVRLADVEIEAGRWKLAGDLLREAVGTADETGQGADLGLALGLLAWLDAAQGREEDCRAHAAEAVALAVRLGSGSFLDRAAPALGLLELGLGRPEEAIPHLEAVRQAQRDQGWSDAAVQPHRSPDLVEAYALAGRIAEAEAALSEFEADATRAGRESALALAARCRGLLSLDEFETAFAEALARGESVLGPFERARTELSLAERLAAAGRRRDAEEPFGAAVAAFERLGAAPWAARARSVRV